MVRGVRDWTHREQLLEQVAAGGCSLKSVVVSLGVPYRTAVGWWKSAAMGMSLQIGLITSTVATLDAITTKYAAKGKEVTITGLNEASRSLTRDWPATSPPTTDEPAVGPRGPRHRRSTTTP